MSCPAWRTEALEGNTWIHPRQTCPTILTRWKVTETISCWKKKGKWYINGNQNIHTKRKHFFLVLLKSTKACIPWTLNLSVCLSHHQQALHRLSVVNDLSLNTIFFLYKATGCLNIGIILKTGTIPLQQMRKKNIWWSLFFWDTDTELWRDACFKCAPAYLKMFLEVSKCTCSQKASIIL